MSFPLSSGTVILHGVCFFQARWVEGLPVPDLRLSRGAAVKPSVLVLGAGGEFGGRLVEAVLESGKPVVAVAPDAPGVDALVRRFGGRCHALAGSTDDDTGASALAKALRALPVRPLQALVNLQRSCVRGRLLDQPPDFLEGVMRGELFPHLHAARHVLPVLASSGRCGRYLVVGMPYAGTPWAGYGHYSVAAAAVRMLVQVLRHESLDSPVRVQQLVIDAPVRTQENARFACRAWPEAMAVARHAARLLTEPEATDTFVQFDPPRGVPPRGEVEETR
jgi:NAD(P)-dependent dehydrogenase (short-subunit alcohol dehydrogenase family)